MTDEECDRVFDQMATELSESGLSWLVDEVRHDIAEGIDFEDYVPIFKEVISEDTEPQAEVRQTRRKAKAILTRDFTAKERLEYLLDAIERTVVMPAFMEKSIIAALSKQETQAQPQGPIVVKFLPPTRGELPHEINQLEIEESVSSAQLLKDRLDELRRELGQ